MSAIAGILRFDGGRPSPEDGERLLGAVAHRGGGGGGSFQEGPVYLAGAQGGGDLSPRRQPAIGERFVVLLDGRIYDHVDLSREVLRREHDGPMALGDAEVVLRAWERWGPSCLSRLDGDFALLVWDRRERTLHLARDPMGARPLHYSLAGGVLSVASLPGALTALPWVSRDLSSSGLSEYLAFRYVHSPRTLLRDVQALPPGHHLELDTLGSRLTAYHRRRFCPPRHEPPPDKEVLQDLERLLRASVERRAPRDEPLGVMLSGGVDSALIALSARDLGHDLRTYHVAFPGVGVDEAAFSGRIAALLGTRHRLVTVDAATFEGALRKSVIAMGGPLPDPAGVAQYVVCREARRDQRVLLVGEGGDELLAGGRVLAVATLMKQVSSAARMGEALKERLGRRFFGRALPGMPALALRPQKEGLRRLVGGTEVFDLEARRQILRPEVDPAPSLRDDVLLPLYDGLETDLINTVLAVYQRGWLVEDGLARWERVGTACGLAVRFPLLDRPVVDLLNGLPGPWKVRWKLGAPSSKWPIRALLKGHLPRVVVERGKRPFPSPLQRWLRHEGACFLRSSMDRLLADRWDLWRPSPVHHMVMEHLRGEANHGARIWSLILLDAWLETLHP